MATRSLERRLLTSVVPLALRKGKGAKRIKAKRDDDTPNKRGRGTKKVPVIGAVERGGRVAFGINRDQERLQLLGCRP